MSLFPFFFPKPPPSFFFFFKPLRPFRRKPESEENTAKKKTKKKRACLLHGAPGTGKTSACHVIAKACGYSTIEFNASDVRAAATIRDTIAPCTQSKSLVRPVPSVFETSLAASSSGASHRSQVPNKVQTIPDRGTVLILDEVDGLCGNSDRGGTAAIVKLLEDSMIPVFLICNNVRKLRSLQALCHCLSWRRPTPVEILPRVMCILAEEEKTQRSKDPKSHANKPQPKALTQVIEACGGDLRQVINRLQMWTASERPSQSSVSVNVQKDLEMTALEATKALFSSFSNPTKRPSVVASAQGCSRVLTSAKGCTEGQLDCEGALVLCGTDPEQVSLFVYENYISCLSDTQAQGFRVGQSAAKPTKEAKRQAAARMEALAAAADSLTEGDTVQEYMNRTMDFDFWESAAMASCVTPVALVSGCSAQTSQPNFGSARVSPTLVFPSLLGRLSSLRKNQRLLTGASSQLGLPGRYLSCDLLPLVRPALLHQLLSKDDVLKASDGEAAVSLKDELVVDGAKHEDNGLMTTVASDRSSDATVTGEEDDGVQRAQSQGALQKNPTRVDKVFRVCASLLEAGDPLCFDAADRFENLPTCAKKKSVRWAEEDVQTPGKSKRVNLAKSKRAPNGVPKRKTLAQIDARKRARVTAKAKKKDAKRKKIS